MSRFTGLSPRESLTELFFFPDGQWSPSATSPFGFWVASPSHLFCWCSVPVLLFIAALPLSHFRSHGARSVYNQRAVYCAAISIVGNQETGVLKEHPGVKKIQTAYYTGVGGWDSFVDKKVH